MYKKSSLIGKVKFLKAEVLLTNSIIIIIITYCDKNFKGKYWAIVGQKLPRPPRDPDYEGITSS
jgi:hypothetical protein